MRATTEVESSVRKTRAYAVVDLPRRLPHRNGRLVADLFSDAAHLSDRGAAGVAAILAPVVAEACAEAEILPGRDHAPTPLR